MMPEITGETAMVMTSSTRSKRFCPGARVIASSPKQKAARGFPRTALFACAGSLFRRCGFGLLLLAEVFAGGLVDLLHRQAGLAAIVEAEQLDLHLLAFLDHVGRLVDARAGQFGNMDEAVLGSEEVHESAEVHDLDDLAVIDLADFRLRDDAADPLERGLDRLAVGGRDLHRAVVLDVDLGAGLFDDLPDHLSARAPHFADLVGRNLDLLDARGMLAELR